MRARFAFVAVTIVLGAAAVFGQDAPGDPVRPELLRGNSLVLDDLNARVDAPDEKWTWFQPRATGDRQMHAFICLRNDTSERIVFTVYAAPEPPLNMTGANAYAQRTAQNLEKSGFVVAGTSCEPSDVPLRGVSYRFGAACKNASGAPVHFYGYVTTARYIYSFQMLSADGTEPRELRRLVSSFRLQRAVTPFLEQGTVYLACFFAIAAGAVGGAALGLAAGRRSVAAAITLLTALALGVAAGILCVVSPQDVVPAEIADIDRARGRAFGFVVGFSTCPALLAAIVLGVVAFALFRRRTTSPTPTPPPSSPAAPS